jgi:anti-sigma factor RsiW
MVHGDGQISEAELAAFADGSLSPRRRAQVAACIERSRELRVLVGAQRAALAAVRALDAPAPARLRALLLRAEPSRPPSRPDAAIAGVPFPNYAARLGTHEDELDGRETRTVFYARGDQRIAYSLAAWNASMDSAGRHTGVSPPPNRLAP